jgi:hypothetical protein
MKKRELVVDRLDALRSAASLDDLRNRLDSDAWYDFSRVYALVISTRSDASELDPGQGIADAVHFLERAVELINIVFVLDPETAASDLDRCDALLALLTDDLADRRRPTSFQAVTIDVLHTLSGLLSVPREESGLAAARGLVRLS